MSDVETLVGICNYYLMATAWADDAHPKSKSIPAGKIVMERRALAKRIVERPLKTQLDALEVRVEELERKVGV
jgi:hypothetical protein